MGDELVDVYQHDCNLFLNVSERITVNLPAGEPDWAARYLTFDVIELDDEVTRRDDGTWCENLVDRKVGVVKATLFQWGVAEANGVHVGAMYDADSQDAADVFCHLFSDDLFQSLFGDHRSLEGEPNPRLRKVFGKDEFLPGMFNVLYFSEIDTARLTVDATVMVLGRIIESYLDDAWGVVAFAWNPKVDKVKVEALNQVFVKYGKFGDGPATLFVTLSGRMLPHHLTLGVEE